MSVASPSTKRNAVARRGFTLVELLMVIMLIGIMASFVLVALAGATQSAKKDRTQAQIMKIHELIMEKWEGFQYRRVPPTTYMLAVQNGLQQPNGKFLANHRLLAMRESMRMEFPTYMWDVYGDDQENSDNEQMTRDSLGKKYIPPVTRGYLRRIANAEAESGIPWTQSGSYQDAECLYLILSQIRDGDESALSFFSENEIGDVDGDGMKEILDGWGNPIRWALWAPGYLSPLQVSYSENPLLEDNMDLSQVGSGYIDQNSNGLPDAFEPQSVSGLTFDYPKTFQDFPRALFPLIYSGGADEKVGIILSTDVDGNVTQNWAAVNNDPFSRDKKFEMYLIGAPSKNTDAKADDISNHYLTR